MVDAVWLHIGTPKSGTSSLQKYFSDNRAALTEQGLAYLTPPGKSSCNDLAIASNRERPELAALAGGLNDEIEARPEKIALLSSEMFYGFSPERLLALMPALADRPCHVLVYLRRQDAYIEAMFLQKSKNGRFFGTIGEYIEKFGGSGSDYVEMLAPWFDAGDGITLVPRILQRDRLAGGEVVADALAQIGLAAPEGVAPEAVNVSPGLHRVQLLQAAAAVGVANPRKLQRQLATRYPQSAAERAPVMSQAERRAFVARYEAGNEALRARFFPDWATLFDGSDLQDEDARDGIAAFTQEQMREIMRLLQVIKDLR